MTSLTTIKILLFYKAEFLIPNNVILRVSEESLNKLLFESASRRIENYYFCSPLDYYYYYYYYYVDIELKLILVEVEMPGEHGEGGYTPKFSEVRKAEESMTAEEAEMTDQREVEAGTYRMDENWITKSNEALEAAEMNGERILEIPVTISYTIKVPESAAVSSWEHGVRLENIIFEQTHNAKALIERAVRKGIEEQDPAIANARKEKSDAESEIRGMVSHNAEAQRFEKNERYDLNRARELFVRIQEIDEQYKTGDSNTAGWMKMIEGLENQPE